MINWGNWLNSKYKTINLTEDEEKLILEKRKNKNEIDKKEAKENWKFKSPSSYSVEEKCQFFDKIYQSAMNHMCYKETNGDSSKTLEMEIYLNVMNLLGSGWDDYWKGCKK